MKRNEAEQIVAELNAILRDLPLAKAVANARFEQLQRQLKASDWRTVIDEFQVIDGAAYGKARLVSADSEDWKRIMDGRAEVT